MDAPAAAVEYAQDMLPLDCVQSLCGGARRDRKGLFHVQRGAGRQYECSLDHVLEFAYVAGPAIIHQRVHHAPGHPFDLTAELAPSTLDDGPHEERNIFSSLSKRRDQHREHRQTVVQVLAETTLGDGA